MFVVVVVVVVVVVIVCCWLLFMNRYCNSHWVLNSSALSQQRCDAQSLPGSDGPDVWSEPRGVVGCSNNNNNNNNKKLR